MNPWALLMGTLAYNYQRHLNRKPTLCSTCRDHAPRWVVVVGWSALSGWLIPHVLRGYAKRNKETL